MAIRNLVSQAIPIFTSRTPIEEGAKLSKESLDLLMRLPLDKARRIAPSRIVIVDNGDTIGTRTSAFEQIFRASAEDLTEPASYVRTEALATKGIVISLLGKSGRHQIFRQYEQITRDGTARTILVRATPRDQSLMLVEAVEQNAQIETASKTDLLTGMPNLRGLEDIYLGKAAELGRRGGGDIGIAMLDIDHFKQVNDTFGHEVGDKVLVWFATIVEKNTRPEDTCARIGGEEFLLIVNRAKSEHDVAFVAEKLRKALENNPIVLDSDDFRSAIETLNKKIKEAETGDNPDHLTSEQIENYRTYREQLAEKEERGDFSLPKTMSCGTALCPVAQSPSQDWKQQTLGSLREGKKMADGLLYMAKQAGRNQVQCSFGRYKGQPPNANAPQFGQF